SWDAEAAVAAVVELCASGRTTAPVYDIATSARTGEEELRLDGAPLFVAEGIFAADIVARCRELGVPVVYSAQVGGQTPEERGLQQDFWGPGLPDDERSAQIPAPVAPRQRDTVLTKWKYSAFARTDLAERMAEAGRDQLIVVGVYAHIGVLLTAADAWMRDIQAFLVADAVADFSEEDHHMALRYAAAKCAVVTTAHTVLAGPFTGQTPRTAEGK
ncbi:isochorismatase family protein, partial [Streptomyces daliensis]|nr:isochorismatase family protein [Streptomyces daliensis]